MRLHPHGRLGCYELLSAIGEGGLGEVWQARDTSNGRLVALRMLPAPPSTDPFRFAPFDERVRKLVSLRHPNVVRIYELLDADSVRALVCEWVNGESLARRIERGPFAVNDAVRIVAQVANGLAAAHSRDIVHGDVKPSNITIGSDGTVKVLDLGIVEVYEPGSTGLRSDVTPAPSARLLGVITGTAAYMSPEQVCGVTADTRSDVWAFGCVLFEMLTGRPAFAADDLGETLMLVNRGQPEWTLIPPNTPPPITDMLRRCLEREPIRRYQRMTDLLAPIRATIGEEGALEAFMRHPALRRTARPAVRPNWGDESWIELEKMRPMLKRWAQGRVPKGLEVDADDVVQDVILSGFERMPRSRPAPQGPFKAYLRERVRTRIRDEIRRVRSAWFAKRPE